MPTKQYKLEYRNNIKLKEKQKNKYLSKMSTPLYKLGDCVLFGYGHNGYITMAPVWNDSKKTFIYCVRADKVKPNGVILSQMVEIEENDLHKISYSMIVT